MDEFNKGMSSIIVVVEWISEKSLDTAFSQVGKILVVCEILRNALACLYGTCHPNILDLTPQNLSNISHILQFIILCLC